MKKVPVLKKKFGLWKKSSVYAKKVPIIMKGKFHRDTADESPINGIIINNFIY